MAFRSPACLSSFFKFKERVSKALLSIVIYQFKYSTCNDTYSDKTKRHFIVRASEHLGISPFAVESVKSVYLCAVNEQGTDFFLRSASYDLSVAISAPNIFSFRN